MWKCILHQNERKRAIWPKICGLFGSYRWFHTCRSDHLIEIIKRGHCVAFRFWIVLYSCWFYITIHTTYTDHSFCLTVHDQHISSAKNKGGSISVYRDLACEPEGGRFKYSTDHSMNHRLVAGEVPVPLRGLSKAPRAVLWRCPPVHICISISRKRNANKKTCGWFALQ